MKAQMKASTRPTPRPVPGDPAAEPPSLSVVPTDDVPDDKLPPGRRTPSFFFLASAAVMGVFTAGASLSAVGSDAPAFNGVATVGAMITAALLAVGILRSMVTRPLHDDRRP